MIKNITHQNFLITPFVAAKEWNLYNSDNSDLILTEPYSASVYIGSDPIALEYLDYNNVAAQPTISRDCNIALDQQESDKIIFEEGKLETGTFDPYSSEKNLDGTYKRLVHNQTKTAFYNKYNNPVQIFGVEYIDFPLSNTVRNISNYFRMFNIPQKYFGDKLVEGSIQLFDNTLDDNVNIYDDGYQNIMAGYNLFSKIQEVRSMGGFINIINSGSANMDCYGPPPLSYALDNYWWLDDPLSASLTMVNQIPGGVPLVRYYPLVPSSSVGYLGYCLDSTDDYGQAAGQSILATHQIGYPGTAFTVMGFIYMPPDYQSYFPWGYIISASPMYLLYFDGGQESWKINFGMYDNGSVGHVVSDPIVRKKSDGTLGVWYFFAYGWDGDKAQISVTPTTQASVTPWTAGASFSANGWTRSPNCNSIAVGGDGTGGSNGYKGKLDELASVTGLLTTAQLQEFYDVIKGGNHAISA